MQIRNGAKRRPTSPLLRALELACILEVPMFPVFSTNLACVTNAPSTITPFHQHAYHSSIKKECVEEEKTYNFQMRW